ncbi:DHA2 family efflux MFS transporter permease subunit [Klebsiella michiganensis]|uniref:DHA2 family efflux MFS transporter permease subunit n=1 Tax=Klebsiella michiganensis TaxID=1134687 RepID=UPI001B823709|nr:DHA2 family efflux MFS transporter permease subunit [Klebsiella michiganensis]MBR7534076.1 DHA2 family efflux MFS transporter permease subunit [Klebsiella michiganensis]MBR7573912.1 DHA2 family efflux MFS transporter permease subunit [Klebsiella michiganensis]
MNINQDRRVKETAHPRPINAIPPMLWMQAAIITLGAFATMLSSTMLSAALPAMAAGLGVTDTAIQWIATAYLMALAAGVPLSAWAARRFGATQLWLYGLILFAIFSAVCALSPRFEVLLAARVLQGLAGGLLVPAGQTILGLVVGRERLGRVIGTIGVAIVIAPLLGTSLGAVLLEICGWRGLFWITVPFCLCACLAGWNLLPRPTIKTDRPLSLDWLGLALVFCSLPMLMAGMKELSLNSGKYGWNVIMLSVGALFTCLFIYRSLRIESPLLHLELFKHRGFTLSAVLMAIGGAVNFGGQFLLPLYFRDVCHVTLAEVGLLLTPQLIGSAIGFPVAGYFSDKLGPRTVLIIGGLLAAFATSPLAMIDAGSRYTLVGGAIAVRGFGLALATVPAMAAGLAMAGSRHVADAAPVLNILQRVGAMAGAALVTACYVRFAHTRGYLAAFHHAGWLLTGGAVLLALCALFMVNHSTLTTPEE